MGLETDLTGESEPTERLHNADQHVREQIDAEMDNERDSEYRGESTTQPFDVDEVLSHLESDQ